MNTNIATTIEQSKRLIAAGLDPKSADMRWETFPGCVPHLCYQQDLMPLIAPKITPAWSLSAIWDYIHNLDKTYEFPTTLSAEKLIEVLTATICYRLEHQ